jgi:hypothetical protein
MFCFHDKKFKREKFVLPAINTNTVPNQNDQQLGYEKLMLRPIVLQAFVKSIIPTCQAGITVYIEE